MIEERSESRTIDLIVRNVSKRFGPLLAVNNVNLEVAHGEVVALLGPSGSGKTTLLSLIGGQLHPDDGDILVSGESVRDLPPNKIDTATVFQDYALFPHMDVGENVGFGLYMRKVPANEIEQRVSEALALVGLEGFERNKVTKLSGGQKQRVATARALVVRPRVLLMDEPLSALDLQIRTRLQKELRELLKLVNVTTIIVTHDQKEAFSLADRVVVLKDGRVEQCGRPADLYSNPATQFVAQFLGGGILLDATVVAEKGSTVKVAIAGKDISVRGKANVGNRVCVMLRPEDLLIQPKRIGEQAVWFDGVVENAMETGETTRYVVIADEIEFSVLALGTARFQHGAHVSIGVPDNCGVVVGHAVDDK